MSDRGDGKKLGESASRRGAITHLSDDETVAKVGHPAGEGRESGGGELRRGAITHLSDDETVAKVGHPAGEVVAS